MSLLAALFGTLGFLAVTQLEHDCYDHLACLPSHSQVRIVHQNEPYGTEMFGFDSYQRRACDMLNRLLDSQTTDLVQYI